MAFCLRLLVVGVAPHLSDDGYRYLWEGLALNHGINPFLTPPSAVTGLDDALRDRVNHPDLTSIYPPLALWWFRAVAASGHSLAWLQLATAAVDATTAALLARVAPRGFSWLYILHPLPVLESAAGAHLEAIAIALCAPALLGGITAPAWVAAGAGAKLLPLAFWPAALRGRSLREKALLTAVAIGWCALLAWPVWAAGPALLGSARIYAETWAFNGFLYPWLQPAIGDLARPLLALIGVGVVGLANVRSPDLRTAWLWVALAFLALSPTVHPWYGLWALVPGIALGRRDVAFAAVALLGGYGVLSTCDPSTGAWEEPAWLWPLTWGPALLALGAGRWLGPDPRDEAPTAA